MTRRFFIFTVIPGIGSVLVGCAELRPPTSPTEEKKVDLIDSVRRDGYPASPGLANNFGARRLLIDGSPNRRFKVGEDFLGIGQPLPDDKLTLDVPGIKVPDDARVTVL